MTSIPALRPDEFNFPLQNPNSNSMTYGKGRSTSKSHERVIDADNGDSAKDASITLLLCRPFVFLFNPSNPTDAINGKLTAGTLTSSELTASLHNKEISALVNMIRSGEADVNVHTTQNQNGEVRGQIS